MEHPHSNPSCQPTSSTPAEGLPGSEPDAQAALVAQRVLLACSEPNLMEALERVVEFRSEDVCPSGLSMERVFDGKACLARLRESQPDLLVIHAWLEGITGVEVVRQFRCEYPNSPMAVVFLSAQNCSDVPEDIDCDAILSLPFENTNLVDQSARALLLKDMR